MSMFSLFTKAGSLVESAKKVAEVGKKVAEAAEILNRDNDKNGKPDLQDKFEQLEAILAAAVKAHVEQAKKELEQIKALGAEILKQLDEVREGVK